MRGVYHQRRSTIKEEVPILVANEEDQVEEEESIAEAAVPELYHPQLTRYNQNELVQFQEAFGETMNEQYERERTIFDQQHQQ
jgi:hypothetical protein